EADEKRLQQEQKRFQQKREHWVDVLLFWICAVVCILFLPLCPVLLFFTALRSRVESWAGRQVEKGDGEVSLARAAAAFAAFFGWVGLWFAEALAHGVLAALAVRLAV
ncbi:MAG: hypothetical protein H5T99_00060, partial [Moorella sp. (in: Bacteria)]|nr:hypothetical protein [Moorella sp. (in: firmicutes)]